MKKTILTILALCLFVPSVFASTADASIHLRQKGGAANTVVVSIEIENPSNQSIKAVQSWLQYDPKILKGVKIETSSSPFDFVAPGENTFDETQGLAKIGRSTLAEGITDSHIFVAEVSFQKLSDTATEISFYNFQVGNDSNTSVRVFEEGFPVNILKQKPQALRLGEKEENVQTPQNTQATNNAIEKKAGPKNLRITSGPEYAILSWEPVNGAQGYNIYYSNTSGRYIQRRGVGNVSEYYLDDITTGKYYYFAVKAYDNRHNETQYSKEVRIRVGYPDSSSAPLTLTASKKILEKTKKHVDSGPAEMLFLLSIVTVFLSILFVKRQKI